MRWRFRSPRKMAQKQNGGPTHFLRQNEETMDCQKRSADTRELGTSTESQRKAMSEEGSTKPGAFICRVGLPRIRTRSTRRRARTAEIGSQIMNGMKIASITNPTTITITPLRYLKMESRTIPLYVSLFFLTYIGA